MKLCLFSKGLRGLRSILPWNFTLKSRPSLRSLEIALQGCRQGRSEKLAEENILKNHTSTLLNDKKWSITRRPVFPPLNKQFWIKPDQTPGNQTQTIKANPPCFIPKFLPTDTGAGAWRQKENTKLISSVFWGTQFHVISKQLHMVSKVGSVISFYRRGNQEQRNQIRGPRSNGLAQKVGFPSPSSVNFLPQPEESHPGPDSEACLI